MKIETALCTLKLLCGRETRSREETDALPYAPADGRSLSLGSALGPAGALLPLRLPAVLAVPPLSRLAGRPSNLEETSGILAGAASLSLNRLELECENADARRLPEGMAAARNLLPQSMVMRRNRTSTAFVDHRKDSS